MHAIAGTDLLCSAITEDNNTRNNRAVIDAVKTYKNNLQKYKTRKIDINELKKSYDNIVVNVKNAQPDETAPPRKELIKTELLWDTVLTIGALIAAPLIIVGGTLLAVFSLLKK